MTDIDLNGLKKTVKAFVIDMDGTVLHTGAFLSETAVSVFKECTGRGYKVIIATGRSLSAAESYRAKLELCGPMIYYNGAEVVDMPSRRVLHTEFLDKETALYCTELAREYEVHFHIFFTTGDDPAIEMLAAEKPSEAAELYADRTGLNFLYTDISERIRHDDSICIKALYIAEPDVLEVLRAKIQAKFAGKVNIAKSAPTFLEIMNRNASKGRALEFVLKELRLIPEEAIAFGDEENDISMLKTAGFSCAPLNAGPDVKKAAHYITGSCDEDGVPLFIKEHFLTY